MAAEGSTSTLAEQEAKEASKALSECLFSQYTWTVVGVGGGTGYALWRRPKNGLGLMLVAGAAGTMADFAYGWKVACRDPVRRWQESQ